MVLKGSAILLIAIAWILFITSFFLPATNVLEAVDTMPGTPLTGWQAFASACKFGTDPLVAMFEPHVLLLLLSPLANALMLVAPAICGLMRANALALTVPLLMSAVLPWALPASMRGDLYLGFYLWNGSFVLMAVGCLVLSFGFLLEEAMSNRRLRQPA